MITTEPVATLLVNHGQTCLDAVRSAGLPLAGPTSVVAVRERNRADPGPLLGTGRQPGCRRGRPPPLPEGLSILRHSTAHLLAQAVQWSSLARSWGSDLPSRMASTTTSRSRSPSSPRP